VQYFSNVADNLAQTPLAAWMLSKSLLDFEKSKIVCENKYGKSKGLAGPSEASLILSNWFHYRHPSETLSCDFISTSAKRNMQQTLSIIEKFAGAPIITKNAWNCFRLAALQSAFPSARFLYLKRNIVDSSYSTLRARRTQGDPQVVWNSASPRELAELKKLPYYEQVVEQQRLTNKAVVRALDNSSSMLSITYEDFVMSPIEVLEKVAGFCSVRISTPLTGLPMEIKPRASTHQKIDPDKNRIAEYCASQGYV
jgi:hypothetical protein